MGRKKKKEKERVNWTAGMQCRFLRPQPIHFELNRDNEFRQRDKNLFYSQLSERKVLDKTTWNIHAKDRCQYMHQLKYYMCCEVRRTKLKTALTLPPKEQLLTLRLRRRAKNFIAEGFNQVKLNSKRLKCAAAPCRPNCPDISLRKEGGRKEGRKEGYSIHPAAAAMSAFYFHQRQAVQAHLHVTCGKVRKVKGS